MQRIMIMGPPGSGKSTMARHIASRHGLPVFYLDQAFHMPGWVTAPADAFHAEVERIAALPAWIIDGNYPDTIAPRLQRAGMIIYLDTSRWLSLLRILRRTMKSHGTVRPDGPAGCPERFTFEFLHFVWSWNRSRRAKTLALIEDFTGETIILRGGSQQRRFLRDGCF